MDEIVIDGDEFLGDNKLQLLEEACAYQPCWFSGDKYDNSDCEQSGKLGAFAFYNDVGVSPNINQQSEVGNAIAKKSPYKMYLKVDNDSDSEITIFDCACDHIDALLQSPPPPQMPFESIPFVPNHRT